MTDAKMLSLQDQSHAAMDDALRTVKSRNPSEYLAFTLSLGMGMKDPDRMFQAMTPTAKILLFNFAGVAVADAIVRMEAREALDA